MGNNSRNCVKRQRPAWWTPEGVLARLQAGEFVMAICQAAADDMRGAGIELSPTTLRAEVSRWCESASWGDQLRAALSLWKKEGSGPGTSRMVLSKAWHDQFFAAMEASGGNAQKAAQAAGVDYGLVLAVTDKRNASCYDAVFAERFRIAEMSRVGVMREKYMQDAETGDGKLAARARERIIEATLPGLHSPRQEVTVSGKVQHAHAHAHQHDHLHELAPGLAREIAMASQDRVRKLSAGRDGSLPDDVIDVTPTMAVDQEAACVD